MFKRYPYWGWLLASLFLWCISGYYFHVHKQALHPESLTKAVHNDLVRQEEILENFISEHETIRHLFADSLSESESRRIDNFPFHVYGYNDDNLIFWNTNTVIAKANDSAISKPIIITNEKGVFVEKCIKPTYLSTGKRLVILMPVLITYPLENDYLTSQFVASPNVPVRTRILAERPATNSYTVAIPGSNSVFYLQFNLQDIPKWVPDSLFIMLLIAALLSSIWWVQLIAISLSRMRSPATGFFVTLFVIVVCRVLLYVYGLPFNLDTLTFFSPSLYASSKYLSSLGDLFINTVFVLWIAIFVVRHTPYTRYFENIRSQPARYVIALILILLLHAYLYLFVSIIIRGLVLDSDIPFDVSHFYSIKVYTILGLLVIVSITGISCLIIYLFNIQLNVLIRNRLIKYLLVAVTGPILILSMGLHQQYNVNHPAFDWLVFWILLGWIVLFIRLLDIPSFTLVSDLFEPRMIFWAVFICLFCMGMLQYFNEAKEQETRKAFVKMRLSPQKDDLMEFSFDNTARRINNDKTLRNFFAKPSLAARKAIDQHIDAQYLSSQTFSKYQNRLYLFNANGYQLYNSDTTDDYSSLMAEKDKSEATNSPYLFYKEDIHDRHFYLAFIPIYDSSANKPVGYIFVDFDSKKQGSQTAVYPELLQTPATKANMHDNEYAYAIYVNDKINAQNNNYPFPTYLRDDTLKKEQDYAFYRHNGVTELYYKLSDRRTIVVIHLHSEIIEMITLFSYLFVILVVLAAVILVYQLYLSFFSAKGSAEKLIRLTLRRRVHFSMLAVVLISFVVIGFVTILFFSSQYNTSNSDKLQSAMQVARQTIQDNLKQLKALDAAYVFDSVARSNSFKSFITTLAAGQSIDINIYNRNGVLLNTSEDDIYNKSLISHMMWPDAYYQLNNLGKSILVQNENVGRLSYLSAYQPLRDDAGNTLGYINVPFFSSEKDLNFQISNIVVTLINLYAFIFLFSSLITVFITRWITKSFSIIIQQFERINLQRNERIKWPYDDEIGLLVTEYNKMVNKVEENAAKLAQSERESAWREMARQVAHEIKNPLTPMKLNIQFLQQAMKNDNPNIKELTDKVSYSIIEQIDNLSYIASEFSNFAKMPEAKPEELELGELLRKAVELYRNDSHVTVSLSEYEGQLFVLSDRSQLLRVFTNLLENAKQAIPSSRAGRIDISVETKDNGAIITIADNGQGIPEDTVTKLFQPYFTTKSSGTGLGLAMTKKIIEFWKGDIWFETKEEVGTAFYIRLPLVSNKN